MGICVFFSGPHGSGKTTLINKLVEKYECFSENDFDVNFLEQFSTIKIMNDFERCLLRLYHRIFIQSYASEKSNKKEEHMVTLVSRSIYDSFAYIETYREIGKFTFKELEVLLNVEEGIGDYPLTVILNPSPGIIMERLLKRRKTGARSERDKLFCKEDTYEFVCSLHDKFERYRDKDGVLYIEDNDESAMEQIYNWLIERITRR